MTQAFRRHDGIQIRFEEELYLSDSMEKLDSPYEVLFKGKSHYMKTDLIGSRYQSSLYWMIMSSGIIQLHEKPHPDVKNT